MTEDTRPRPVRLNNPGDLDRVPNNVWDGEAPDQPDPRFVKFISPEYGFRALARTLQSYVLRDGCETYALITNRWAPRTENNTPSYLATVCGLCTAHPNDVVNPNNYHDMHNLVWAIAMQEGGRGYWTHEQVDAGLAMLGLKPT